MPGLLPDERMLLLVGISAISLVVPMVALPCVLVRLRPDHFSGGVRHVWLADRHVVVRLLGHGLKRAAGIACIAAGIAMLFLPGQGVLTILMGLVLLDSPSMRRLELHVVSRPFVLREVNRLRARFGRPPLLLPDRRAP